MCGAVYYARFGAKNHTLTYQCGKNRLLFSQKWYKTLIFLHDCEKKLLSLPREIKIRVVNIIQ